MSDRPTRVEVVEQWGDISRVRITSEFATEEDARFLEACARVTLTPVLAITGGSVRANDQELVGSLREAGPARRDYLWERDRRKRDPLLVQRHGPGTVHLRVFPIHKDIRVVTTIEGFALAPGPASSDVRLYRTGLLYLAVVPLDHASAARAELRDEEGGRALLLLGRHDCLDLFPGRIHDARVVPGVCAIGAAIRGTGDDAATDETVLVALPPGSRAPRDLFVGDPKDAPWIPGDVPPGLREPTDPTPPPPPPPVAKTAGPPAESTARPPPS